MIFAHFEIVGEQDVRAPSTDVLQATVKLKCLFLTWQQKGAASRGGQRLYTA